MISRTKKATCPWRPNANTNNLLEEVCIRKLRHTYSTQHTPSDSEPSWCYVSNHKLIIQIQEKIFFIFLMDVVHKLHMKSVPMAETWGCCFNRACTHFVRDGCCFASSLMRRKARAWFTSSSVTDQLRSACRLPSLEAVSYTHLTLPTKRIV